MESGPRGPVQLSCSETRLQETDRGLGVARWPGGQRECSKLAFPALPPANPFSRSSTEASPSLREERERSVCGSSPLRKSNCYYHVVLTEEARRGTTRRTGHLSEQGTPLAPSGKLWAREAYSFCYLLPEARKSARAFLSRSLISFPLSLGSWLPGGGEVTCGLLLAYPFPAGTGP